MSEVKMETMEDFASELEASYKEMEERQNRYADMAEGNPNAEAWAELVQMMQDKTVVKVKIKEAVKAGVIAYVGEIQGFIPASQISVQYVENLEDWVGKYLEVLPITVEPERKKLVLSGKVVMKEREAAAEAEKLASCKAGDIAEGVVETIKPYGAFVKLENGLSGLLHISQISRQRIKHPGVVLQEGQKVTVKVISVADGKLSLGMKQLEEEDAPAAEETFDYKEESQATTGLGALLKGIKL